MPTLHIEHAIQRPVDDPQYVVIDLDFDTTNEAEAFVQFLREKVRPLSENAAALAGTPQTKILEPATNQ